MGSRLPAAALSGGPFCPVLLKSSVSLSGLCMANCLLRVDAEQATGASSLWKEGSGWRVDLKGYPSRHCSLHGVVAFLYSTVLITWSPNGLEPPGKPKNTGVGSLSLLQGIFLTQKLNRGLLHCRRILH